MPQDPVAAIAALSSSRVFGSWLRRFSTAVTDDVDAFRRSSPGPVVADGQGKAVKDALWGMIPISAAEVRVVDSPFVQRLRRVRQLGVGYLTYPSAGYSRFEHAIGSMHQSDRMLNALTTRSAPDVVGVVERHRRLVRLAALLHDVGHLPLSHLGENYYSVGECRDEALARECDDVKFEVKLALKVRPSLGEILSAVVILSEPMRRVLADAGYTDDEVSAAACCVMGRPPDAERLFVSQIISNSVDADKLDYMFRDSAATRVPLAVDLDRLLYKIKCVRVPVSDLGSLVSEISTMGSHALALATDLAGNTLAYDLLAARSMLFERIYLHHKTRAAERVALDLYAVLNRHPVDLLTEDDAMFTRYGPWTTPFPPGVRALETRTLPRRAFAMSFDSLVDGAQQPAGEPVIVPESDKRAWDELEQSLVDAAKRSVLAAEIEAVAARLRAGTAHGAGWSPTVPVWLEPVPKPYAVNDTSFLVERPDRSTVKPDSYPPQASAFTRSPQSFAFVFAGGAPDDRVSVHVAAELVMAERFGLHLGRGAADAAKVRLDEAERLKRAWESVCPDVYAGQGRLRPPSEVARTDSNARRAGQLADRWRTFDSQTGPPMTAAHVLRFLDQFPEPLVQEMLELLETVTFLDRQGLVTALGGGAERAGDTSVVLTRDPAKSAGTLPYLTRDSLAPFVDLAEALREPGRGVTFVDDFVISGRQARTAVQVMLGLDPDLPEEVSVSRPLTDNELAALRDGRSVAFRFAYATTAGLEALRELLVDTGLPVDVSGGVARDLEAPSTGPLTDFLRQVGLELLTSTKATAKPDKWTAGVLADRALGYGNAHQLVTTYYNCPTGTVTALWCQGEFRGSPWVPLFPRRDGV